MKTQILWLALLVIKSKITSSEHVVAVPGNMMFSSLYTSTYDTIWMSKLTRREILSYLKHLQPGCRWLARVRAMAWSWAVPAKILESAKGLLICFRRQTKLPEQFKCTLWVCCGDWVELMTAFAALHSWMPISATCWRAFIAKMNLPCFFLPVWLELVGFSWKSFSD